MRFRVLYPIVVLSGFCSLGYQVAWMKMLGPLFGHGVYAMSAVVTAFMFGLVVGSVAGGRAVDRSRDPLRLYAGVELAQVACALVLPLAFHLGSDAIRLAGRLQGPDAPLSAEHLMFVLSFVVLLVPCSLLGAKLPMLSRIVIARAGSDVARHFGLVYALNTGGSLLGCLVPPLLLFGELGLVRSTWVIAGLNLGVALAVLLVRRLGGRTPAGAAPPPAAAAPRPRGVHVVAVVILTVAFGTGFFGLLHEILWTRSIKGLLSMNVYTAPIILAVFLLGTSVGALFKHLVLRFRGRPLGTHLALLVAMTGTLAAVLLSYRTVMTLPPMPPSIGVVEQLTICLKVMLPASLGMGVVFPLLTDLYATRADRVGTDVGRVFAVNTLGSMVGSYTCAFVLIGQLGLRGTLMLSVGVYLAATFLVAATSFRRWWAVSPAVVIAAAAAIGTFVAVDRRIPPRLFEHAFEKHLANVPLFAGPRTKLVYYGEDPICSVAVVEKNTGYGKLHSLLFSNGVAVSAEDWQGGLSRSVFRLHAHVPLLLHPDPKTVANIGLGTGVTASTLAAHDELTRVDTVEICPSVVEAVRSFPHGDALLSGDGVSSVSVADGRTFLTTREGQYDLLLVYPHHPVFDDGSIHFYTRDFFEICRDALTDTGMLVIWFPDSKMPTARPVSVHLESRILTTMAEVFPHMAEIEMGPDAAGRSVQEADRVEMTGLADILIATNSMERLQPSAEELRLRYAASSYRVREDLRISGIAGADDWIEFVEERMSILTAAPPSRRTVLTDDRTYVDYVLNR